MGILRLMRICIATPFIRPRMGDFFIGYAYNHFAEVFLGA